MENMSPEEIGQVKRQLLYKEIVEEEEAQDEDWMAKEIAMLQKEEKTLKDKKKLTKQDIANIVEEFPDISMKF